MSSGNLTGLAAIVGKKRSPDAEEAVETAPPANADATPARPAARKPRRAAMPEPTTSAKYTDPDRVQLKAYVRRDTKIEAVYKWQKEGRGDVSDLIEHLMTEYLNTN